MLNRIKQWGRDAWDATKRGASKAKAYIVGGGTAIAVSGTASATGPAIPDNGVDEAGFVTAALTEVSGLLGNGLAAAIAVMLIFTALFVVKMIAPRSKTAR